MSEAVRLQADASRGGGVGAAGGHAIAYRPDIDGLRAVAVLAVVLYHAGAPGLTGGFVGVDVFFVISGYLITLIIWREQQEGRFSLLRFYERRIRRIAPALAAVALACAAFVLMFKTAEETAQFGETISFLGLMATNFFFFGEQGYFATPLDKFMLLHTWSLSVEEQFYIVFPLMLLWAGRAGPGRARLMVLGLGLVSFVACAVWTPIDQTAAFYLTPFRLWELAIGAALALGAVPAAPARWREALAALGAALVLAPMVLYSDETLFPGVAAAAPTLGAALIIHTGGAGGASLVARILSVRPMVYIGLISYALYLWHWPVLSAAAYLAIRPLTPLEIAACVALSFALASASLHLLERPIRRGAAITRPIAFGIGGASAAALIAIGVGFQESDGWPGRYPDALQPLLARDANRWGGVEGPRLIPSRARIPELPPPVRSFRRFQEARFPEPGPDDAPAFLVWGDSHASAMFQGYYEGAERAGWRRAFLSVAGTCPPVLGFVSKRFDGDRNCALHNQAVFEALERLNVRAVVLVATWSSYFNHRGLGADMRDDLRATVLALGDKGVAVAVAAPAPTYKVHVPSALFRAARLGLSPPIDHSRARYDRLAAPLFAALEPLTRAGAATLIPVHERICDAQICHLKKGDLPLYADRGHVNIHGARLIADDAYAFFKAAR